MVLLCKVLFLVWLIVLFIQELQMKISFNITFGQYIKWYVVFNILHGLFANETEKHVYIKQ